VKIYVPNMLGLVMFREMGPLVTAILLAARSGSAFAAEIGTMHVNEELDALSTMGISPVRFLVGPRLLSSLAVVPVMTLFFNFASLVGGALVMVSIGFPLVTFTSRVFANVTATDLIGSLIKILVFSVLVTGVSCLKGLRTGGGADAVGRSTTGAVVAGSSSSPWPTGCSRCCSTILNSDTGGCGTRAWEPAQARAATPSSACAASPAGTAGVWCCAMCPSMWRAERSLSSSAAPAAAKARF
jgi:hypothetical protein